jgi:DNA-binding response OmpR family regulator
MHLDPLLLESTGRQLGPVGALTPSVSTRLQPRRLLVVQHNPFVARSFARLFQRHYAEVVIASSASVAEVALANDSHTPTDVLCGEVLGDQRASDCIGSWRRSFPGIQRVIMVTGARDLPDEVDGVDAVVLKPVDPGVLTSVLTDMH